MNFVKLICVTLIFISFKAVSQTEYPKMMVFEKDTVVVFSFEQSIELAKRNEELKYMHVEYDILTKKYTEQTNIVSSLEGNIISYKEIVESKDGIITEKDNSLSMKDDEIKLLKKAVRKQKFHKIVVATVGGAIIVALLVF